MFYRAILRVLLSSVLSSQTINGSMTGSVTDRAKAVVAAAKIVATSFGQITRQVQNPRNIQFGLKLYF